MPFRILSLLFIIKMTQKPSNMKLLYSAFLICNLIIRLNFFIEKKDLLDRKPAILATTKLIFLESIFRDCRHSVWAAYE